MRLLDVEASDDGTLPAVECPARAKAYQVSGGGTLMVGSSIPEMVGCLLFFSACEARDGGCVVAGGLLRRWQDSPGG